MTQAIWKIGSRWGNQGPSVLSMFLNYGCVFFGSCTGGRIGDFTAVKEDDLFLICDKSTPVAIGRALGGFVDYHDRRNRISFIPSEQDFTEPDVQICRAVIAILPPEERTRDRFHPDPRRRFCRHTTEAPVLESWVRLCEKKKKEGGFEINCRTQTLYAPAGGNGLFNDRARYRIPIYQRPYSWGEPELRRLVEDLKRSLEENFAVFMGTMQLSEPEPLDAAGISNSYNVIDGQQRLSTFMVLFQLLRAMLGIEWDKQQQGTLMSYVNRGAAQSDLVDFWTFLEAKWNLIKEEKPGVLYQGACFEMNPYLRNLRTLHELLIEKFSDEGETDSPSPETLRRILDLLQEKVRFVVIETRAGLSETIRIFNTINTTGLDLGADDLFKLRFYEYRTNVCGDDSEVFEDLSAIYEKVEKGYRKKVSEHKHAFTMPQILGTYQRVLVARHGLSYEAYAMSRDRFFESLFDSAMHINKHPNFDKMHGDGSQRLDIDDLNRIFDCYKAVYACLDSNERLKILQNFLWRTRYGHYLWDYLIIARFFDESLGFDQMRELLETLFKLVAVPSLRWAKQVYDVRSRLHKMLQELGEGKSALELVRHHWQDASTQDMRRGFEARCMSAIAYNPTWKNLACSLCEYLAQVRENRCSHKVLFETNFDIEHIRSYTDKDDRDAVWTEWEEELDCLGNLVLLESWLNRSVGNDQGAKPGYYKESCFLTVQERVADVATWSKEQAAARKEQLTRDLMAYLFPPPASR